MNLFFSFLLALVVTTTNAFAADVSAFYYASCKRHLGIVLAVNTESVDIVDLQGNLVSLPRYQVIYWATYPVGELAIPISDRLAGVPRWKIFARQNYKKVLLVEGWPVDFTEDKLSFLTMAGTRQVIDLESIAEIQEATDPLGSAPSGPDGSKTQIPNFIHPPVFRDCPLDNLKSVTAYPEQILSDPIAIKREFDRLQAGHKRVEKYGDHQRFYAVPQLYKNRTYLGIWQMFGSRYGQSVHRSNNLTPVLIDQTSKGPFGFQQSITTGAAPIPYGSHEETQIHFFYGFKADYFHFSAMLDPTIFFLGNNYDWGDQDLANNEDKIVDKYFAELGFDYGVFSLMLFPANGPHIGFKEFGLPDKVTINAPKVGISYRDHRMKVEALFASGLKGSFKLITKRANLSFEFTQNVSATVSLISRAFEFTDKGSFFTQAKKFKSDSFTAAGYLNYYFLKKYYIGALLSRETVERNFGRTDLLGQNNEDYWKSGINFSIGF